MTLAASAALCERLRLGNGRARERERESLTTERFSAHLPRIFELVEQLVPGAGKVFLRRVALAFLFHFSLCAFVILNHVIRSDIDIQTVDNPKTTATLLLVLFPFLCQFAQSSLRQ